MVIMTNCTCVKVEYDGIEVEVRDVWLLQHANSQYDLAASLLESRSEHLYYLHEYIYMYDLTCLVLCPPTGC